jgi:hypothetical protein
MLIHERWTAPDGSKLVLLARKEYGAQITLIAPDGRAHLVRKGDVWEVGQVVGLARLLGAMVQGELGQHEVLGEEVTA